MKTAGLYLAVVAVAALVMLGGVGLVGGIALLYDLSTTP